MQVGEGEETKGKQESWDMSPCSYCEPAVRWQAIFTSAISGLQGLGSGGEWNAVHVHIRYSCIPIIVQSFKHETLHS